MKKNDFHSSTKKAITEHLHKEGFPLKVACIDIGTNAIRFMASEFLTPTKHLVLDVQRAPIRLGHTAFISGRLEESTMRLAIGALESFRKRMKVLGIVHYRAVATSAVRESSNGELFVKRAQRKTGLDIEIISGSEEARLVYVSVKARLPLHDMKWVIANLGGGSLEISLIDKTGILWNQTHHIGAVRLYEELSDVEEKNSCYYRLLSEYISTLRVSKHHIPQGSGYIATGGNIEELARLAGLSQAAGLKNTLALSKLDSIITMLSKFTCRERISRLKLKKDRADVILPAALIYKKIADLIGAKKILVPFVGTKEGILFDLVDGLTVHSAHEIRQTKQLSLAAIGIGRHYQFDQRHGLHVAHLARSLFDQALGIHKLTYNDRNILYVAAILHDIGTFISYKSHHRHSLYLISQSELPGLTFREMLIVANVARYHRKSEPSLSHEHYAALSSEEQSRVSKMASLLRVADALDREHLQNVKDIAVTADRARLILVPEVRGDTQLEAWVLTRKGKLFAKIFGLKIKLVTKPS